MSKMCSSLSTSLDIIMKNKTKNKTKTSIWNGPKCLLWALKYAIFLWKFELFHGKHGWKLFIEQQQWRNFVTGCPWVPVAQNGVGAPGEVNLDTTQLTQGCNAQAWVPPKPGCPRVCPPWAHRSYATEQQVLNEINSVIVLCEEYLNNMNQKKKILNLKVKRAWPVNLLTGLEVWLTDPLGCFVRLVKVILEPQSFYCIEDQQMNFLNSNWYI